MSRRPPKRLDQQGGEQLPYPGFYSGETETLLRPGNWFVQPPPHQPPDKCPECCYWRLAERRNVPVDVMKRVGAGQATDADPRLLVRAVTPE